MLRVILLLATAAAWAVPVANAAGQSGDTIPERPASRPIPQFIGGPWTSQPVSLLDAPTPPRHPFMAPNDRSNLHQDAYQSGTANWQGPLGRDMERLAFSNTGVCGSITFDSRDRLVTVCVGLARPVLKLLDPKTLNELASMDLPPRQSIPANVFQDFTGGGYFYLDHRDRAIIPTTTRHIYVVGQTQQPGFRLERDYDVSGTLASEDKIISALPDWSGRIWYASIRGVVGVLDPASGAAKVFDTKEPIGNSHAVDEDGAVYIVTDGALYRFDADSSGAPKVTWRQPYPNIGQVKPGQTQRGSGTTPDLMGRDYVTITDNADPMNVVVYRRARSVRGSRFVCSQPVFRKGASSTDNSLITTATSIVVENNYGYTGPTTTTGGSTEPGVERVDIDADGRGCHTVWRSSERSPSVVPKLSLENGLVYLYTKDPDPAMDDPWYLTAVDFRTGKTVWKRNAGNGLGFNNNYAPVTLGPDGTAYVGVLGGMVGLRDRTPPPRVTRPSGLTGARAPKLLLGLYGLHRRRTPRRMCAPRHVRALVAGRDKRHVRRAVFSFGPRLSLRRVRNDGRAPFLLRIRRRVLRSGRTYSVRVQVTLKDGRRLRLSRSFRAC
jgi:outer membrane protein assembly factor BamB